MEHTFCFRFFLFIFFLTATLSLQKANAQDISPIIISEVQIAGEKADDEFIELYNTTDQDIDVNGWKLRKKSKDEDSTMGTSIIDLKMADTLSVNIPAKGYLLWANSKGTLKTKTIAQLSTGNSFTNDTTAPYSIALFDVNNTLIDALTWGSNHNNPFVPNIFYPINPAKKTSIERDLVTNTFVLQSSPTPKNTTTIITKPTPMPTPTPTPTITPTFSTSTSIRINEILPDPTVGQEFIELYNVGDTDVDLNGWSLSDASKTGKYTFKDSVVIKAHSHLTLSRDIFSFALNNTDETLTLRDPNETIIDTVQYAKSYEDISYDFSPTGWRWSALVTPNATNQFSASPESKTTLPKNIYRDIPAEFHAKSDDENIRYLWDFGDGHTSRLANATHTYDKTGTYRISLTLATDIEDIVKTYSVKVRALPVQKMLITEINPNPTGLDTGNESITIKNTSSKKINLLHWSIATGTDKKTLANHPITTSLVVKPGKELLLTHNMSAFTLPNKGGFIELRQLDKKVVDKIQYASSEGERENMRYQLSFDEKTWSWAQTDTVTTTNATAIDAQNNANADSLIQETPVQHQNISTENDIINRLDTLSVEELSLLKTRIEEKLATAMNAEAKPLTENIAVKTGVSGTIDTEFSPQQSFLYTPESPAEKIISLVDNNIPTRKIVASLTRNTSLLAQEPLFFPGQNERKDQKMELVRHLNQTINNFLQK
jgi:hypothetical protein